MVFHARVKTMAQTETKLADFLHFTLHAKCNKERYFFCPYEVVVRILFKWFMFLNNDTGEKKKRKCLSTLNRPLWR